jgi:hypothetical protein
MPKVEQRRARIPVPAIITGVLALLMVIGAVIYLSRAPKTPASDTPASAEAKRYLQYLVLSDVNMKATLNFMQQQVVEVEGKIANNGPRPVQAVEVYCVFFGVNGREIHRERVPVVQSKTAPLKSGEMRNFRLPFDSLPDTWNQAMPRIVIAKIAFAR